MEGHRKTTAKKEFPPDPIKEAYAGESFVERDILVLAKMLADGKKVNPALFKGAKFKLYESGVKDDVVKLSERINKVYKKAKLDGSDTGRITLEAVEGELLRDYIRSNPRAKQELDEKTADDFKKQKEENYKKRPTLSLDTDKIEETIERLTQSLHSGTETREDAIAQHDYLERLQRISTDETRTKYEISKLEAQLNSTEVPESKKGRIEEERDTLRRKLAKKGKKARTEENVHAPRLEYSVGAERPGEEAIEDAEWYPAEAEADRNSIDPSIIMLPDLSNSAMREEESKAPVVGREELSLSESAELLRAEAERMKEVLSGTSTDAETPLITETPIEEATVSETRKNFDALRERLKKQSEITKGQGGVLELSEEQSAQSKGMGTTKEVAPLERGALSKAEQEYREAYKEFHKNKKFWNLREPQALKNLEQKYNQAQVVYAYAMNSSMRARLAERFTARGENMREPNETGTLLMTEKAKAIESRYRRLIQYNEVIKPALDLKQNARVEALSEKERGILSRSVEWLGKKNAQLESATLFGRPLGKNGARAVRALTTTLVLAPVAFTGAGLFAFAGWGTWKVAKSVGTGALASGIGEWYEKTRGKSKQLEAANQLDAKNKEARDAVLTYATLTDLQKSREVLTHKASDEHLKSKKMWLQVATALGLGAGSSAVSMWANWDSLHEVASSQPSGAGGPSLDSHTQMGGSTQSQVSVGSPKFDAVPVGSGEGANQLMLDLKHQFTEHPDFQKQYPVVFEKLQSGKSSEVGQLLGLSNAEGKSFLQIGDKIEIKPNGTLVLDRLGGKSHVLIDTKGELKPLHLVRTHATHEQGAHHAHKTTHHETHKAHVTEEHLKTRQVQRTGVFDAKADHEAVARANRNYEELIRVQPATATEIPPMTGLPETAPVLEGLHPVDTSSMDNSANKITHGESVGRDVTSSSTIDTSGMERLETPESPSPQVSPEYSHRTGVSEVRKEGAINTSGMERLEQPIGPIASPEVSQSNSIFSNAYNVPIDGKTPHVYVTVNQHIDVFGGTGSAPRLIAEQYARAHPDTVVRFQAWTPDALGNPVAYVAEVVASKDGILSVHVAETGENMTPPDPATFTRLIP